MLELLCQLCAVNGVSGDEDAVRAFIRERVEPWADSVRTDVLGNLIVFKKGKASTGNKLVLAAHMDEVGVIVTGATADGFLKFSFVGGVDRRVVLGKQVVLGPEQVPGIIGIKAIHLFAREDEDKIPKKEDLYIDIGAAGKDEALGMVPLGTCGYFAGAPELFGDGMLKAKAIDDRVGCAVMMELLKEELPLDTTFVFTAMEEVGSCGAVGAAFSIAPEVALILEGTTAADLAGVPDHRKVCRLGCGPALLDMDLDSIYDRPLLVELWKLAADNGIPCQAKEAVAGGNDGGSFQRSRTGVRVVTMAAPVRYLHSPTSVGKVSDFEDMLRLTRLFLGRMAEIFSRKVDGYGTV